MTTGLSPDDVRQQMVILFAQAAEGYDEKLRFVRLTAARLVAHAALQPGERVLDAGTGTGHAALDAAAAVSPDNNVSLAGIFSRHLATYGLQNPSPVSRELADAGRCQALLEAAGFAGVTVHTEQLGYYYRNVQEFWEETRHQNVRVVALLTPDQLAQFHRDLVTEVAGLATDAGIWRSLQGNFYRGFNRLCEE